MGHVFQLTRCFGIRSGSPESIGACRATRQDSAVPEPSFLPPNSPEASRALSAAGERHFLSTACILVPTRSWKGSGTSPAAQPVGGVGHLPLLASLLWPEPLDFVLWQDTLSCAGAALEKRVAVGASVRGRARCSLHAGKLPAPDKVVQT